MTDLIEILRVEAVLGGKVGVGPYNSDPWTDSLDAEPGTEEYLRHSEAREAAFRLAPMYADTRPTPDLDPLDSPIGIAPGEVCGFTTRGQLLEWFPPAALTVLLSTGYYALFRYRVPATAVRVGTYQAVFNPASHVAKEHVPLAAVLDAELV